MYAVGCRYLLSTDEKRFSWVAISFQTHALYLNCNDVPNRFFMQINVVTIIKKTAVKIFAEQFWPLCSFRIIAAGIKKSSRVNKLNFLPQ